MLIASATVRRSAVTQTADTTTTLDVIDRFNEAFNRHDVEGIMALMTNDVVFENTSPRPDGERYDGQESVRGFWEQRTPTASPAMSAASTSSASVMAKSRRSFRTLRASPGCCHSEAEGGERRQRGWRREPALSERGWCGGNEGNLWLCHTQCSYPQLSLASASSAAFLPAIRPNTDPAISPLPPA